MNYKTAAAWWDSLIQINIIRPPVLKRKSFLNFREYYTFMNVEDPHDLYLNLQNKQGIVYYNVQTGFANFKIVSKTHFLSKVTLLFPVPDLIFMFQFLQTAALKNQLTLSEKKYKIQILMLMSLLLLLFTMMRNILCGMMMMKKYTKNYAMIYVNPLLKY